MIVKKLLQANQDIAPITVAEAVLVNDNGEIERLDNVLSKFNNQLSQENHSYNQFEECLVIGESKSKSRSSLFYLIECFDEYEFYNNCLIVKGNIRIPIEENSIVKLSFEKYDPNTTLTCNNNTYNMTDTFAVSSAQHIDIFFSNYVYINNIEIWQNR